MSEETRTDQESEALDLSIILTQPPGGSPPEVLARVTIACDMLGLRHIGEPLLDPLTGREREDLRWYLEDYWKWPYLEFATRGRQVEELIREVGQRLYQVVFGSSEAQSILQVWNQQPDVQRQISIMSDSSRVLSLPWELLHDASGFLILNPPQPISIVRRLPQPEQALVSLPLEPPLRILLITARPEGAGFIDARSIARELMDEVQAQVDAGAIEMEFLRPPTFSNLQARLRERKRPIHVLHFDGHGAFDDGRQGQGLLLFETGAGRPNPVRGSDLAKILRDSGVRLAVLTACQSAMSAQDDTFSSVAAQLIRNGIDAVVAMSSSILVASATRYAEVFYHSLAAGVSVPLAQERTRQALYDDPRRHVFRHRDEEGAPVELLDWWVPHFYQQRTVLLRPVAGESRSGHEQLLAPSAPHLSEEMPAAPRYGFSGRARELLQIERWLLQGKLIVMHGFGGIGKTALAREAAVWLTRTGMYGGACFISFEHGGDAAWLLSVLGAYLGVYDGSYNPNDPVRSCERLRPVLKERHILVISDNLESVLPRGEASLAAEGRTQLWDVLLELANMGAGVLVTSRNPAFDDERLVQGSRVAYLELHGLHPEDAYALATRLFGDLGISPKCAPYGELSDLLKQLDHHPLAIQLVLPKLGSVSLSEIRTDFAALLPTFVDDTVAGRNRSLLASLDYSLRRLTEKQLVLLRRLAPFEGGASQDNLGIITEIPQNEWAELRMVLEQAALLTVEQVYADRPVFLRFHPVLTSYLRNQLTADDVELLRSYATCYSLVAYSLYHEDYSDPQSVRAVVRRELPNLRFALELLLQVGDLNPASFMVEHIAKFLNSFGLSREYDKLQRRVGEAIAASSTSASEALTWAEWLRERGAGDDEFERGDLRAAYTRFKALLSRIEALPEGQSRGRRSYEHCATLQRLARCLEAGRQPIAAESLLHEALSIIDALISQHPNDETLSQQRSALLADLGDVLSQQGQYSRARKAYEESWQNDLQNGTLSSQPVILTQLGTLAWRQGNYTEAISLYTRALALIRTLNEPASEATIWYQLGMVAETQENWPEAERCYRESLAITERLGDVAGIARICGRLGWVAKGAGRLSEAEGWCKRAIALSEQIDPNSPRDAQRDF